jgi:hypothetical protein
MLEKACSRRAGGRQWAARRGRPRERRAAARARLRPRTLSCCTALKGPGNKIGSKVDGARSKGWP